MSHFLQTPAWGEFQKALGRTVVEDSGEGWRYLAILEKGRINSRLYTPYGPVVNSLDYLPAALSSLVSAAKKLGAVFVRVEPLVITPGDTELSSVVNAFESAGLRRTNYVQPEQTWRVDLTQSEEQVLSGLSKTGRNLYRNYSKKGLSIRSSDSPEDVEDFLQLVKGVAEQADIRQHPDSYFRRQVEILLPRGNARLYFVDFEGSPIAASLVYDDDNRRYYAHAGASYEHRRLHPGNVLVTQMMLDARESGKAEFDFYGVSPADQPDHAWAGFSKFKRSFGGYDYHFTGTWELPVKVGGYTLYRLLRRIMD
ncbi:peptidoglycan bridge formation glycyltransferase FemA/FemB family protein [Lysinibacter sp. HNR]|uniref:lipid II:glycine glycyltransferase FemX n=1 Tax=Lysinibacter sp. HNR TaxID=3031408 RepID=UPI00243568F1|nr:peptidoglycan bridge formation glycyltransferase FemA/FemB family protein [Lysinibacter sp. HNR]WGD38266.1 peptidoglycan bridge formation glycyltransferase FemA/FemB family protein [Lysinibacter sp. HNR]